MRIKKHKNFQRNIAFFVKHFKFKAPYHILIDGTFAKAALDNRVNMREQLPKYLDGAVKLLTTPCVHIETEKLGPELYGALQILKQMAIEKCPHGANPLSAPECIKSMIKAQSPKNSSQDETKYIVATQDHGLRSAIRLVVGVPLMQLYGSAPTLEKPSHVTNEYAESLNLKQMEVLNYQKEILDHMKESVFGTGPSVPERKGTKKRKRAGPNPLSCKKAKKVKLKPKVHVNAVSTIAVKKRRKRVRVAKHVKVELCSKTKKE